MNVWSVNYLERGDILRKSVWSTNCLERKGIKTLEWSTNYLKRVRGKEVSLVNLFPRENREAEKENKTISYLERSERLKKMM